MGTRRDPETSRQPAPFAGTMSGRYPHTWGVPGPVIPGLSWEAGPWPVSERCSEWPVECRSSGQGHPKRTTTARENRLIHANRRASLEAVSASNRRFTERLYTTAVCCVCKGACATPFSPCIRIFLWFPEPTTPLSGLDKKPPSPLSSSVLRKVRYLNECRKPCSSPSFHT
jgi:hypothetical protein